MPVRSIEDILFEIEQTLNTKMEEFNDSLFDTKKKPPHVHFNSYNSYKFETPDNTGTGSNYKGMIVYDLAVLFTTALPALSHDSLLFKNLGKDIEDGIIKIYNSTSKQILIAYDKQGDCRPATQKILEDNCVLRLSLVGYENVLKKAPLLADGNGLSNSFFISLTLLAPLFPYFLPQPASANRIISNVLSHKTNSHLYTICKKWSFL